jgi:hypothetical protein
MKPNKRRKSSFEMTPAERDADVAKYDKPIPLSQTRPLTKKERALFEKMRGTPVRSIRVMLGRRLKED